MKQACIFLLILTQAVAQPPTLRVEGRVIGYVTNRIGDYEGLRLQPPTGDAVALRFPPHAAGQVVKVGPVGQLVDAEARLPQPGHADADARPGHPGADRSGSGHPGSGHPGRGHREQYRLLRLSRPATGATLDLRELPPPPPRAGQLVEKAGNLTGTFTDERGHLVGLLIDKTYLLELRPHQSELVRPLLGAARRIGFSGYQRPSAGFVNQTGRAVVRLQTLTIDGKTYAF